MENKLASKWIAEAESEGRRTMRAALLQLVAEWLVEAQRLEDAAGNDKEFIDQEHDIAAADAYRECADKLLTTIHTTGLVS